MKRITGVLMIVFCSSMLLYAQYGQEASKGTEMTGVICHSKCVTHDAGQAACDQTCTDKSSDVVFIDDSGKITKIANPDVAKGKMGKKVKCHGEMMESGDMMKVYDVVFANPPG